ncbi:MAG TPA: DUF6625 family protein [Cyclobacteriaceae bacterium]|nr:DUF6625 family protein [Cyclobacteriaceae bacterium]
MERVCVIIPYFGRWPAYLDLFLHGCRRNKALDFLFFTDLEPPVDVPDNVKFHFYTLDNINRSMTRLLGFESMITKPYKLCDVRPAYGLLFQEYIHDFDFWGWGDVDVVYGNLTSRLSAEVLSNDVISFRKKWLSGSLTLIRNSDFMNRLFLKSPDLRMIFGSTEYLGFDEVSKYWVGVRTRPISEISFPYDNFTRLVLDASTRGAVKAYLNDHAKESILVNDYVRLKDGKIVDVQGREYAYYHFITEKGKPYFVYPDWDNVPDQYVIDRTGFYTSSQFERRGIIGMWRRMRAVPQLGKRFLVRSYRKILQMR